MDNKDFFYEYLIWLYHCGQENLQLQWKFFCGTSLGVILKCHLQSSRSQASDDLHTALGRTENNLIQMGSLRSPNRGNVMGCSGHTSVIPEAKYSQNVASLLGVHSTFGRISVTVSHVKAN